MTPVDAAEATWADDGGRTPDGLVERRRGTTGWPVDAHGSTAGGNGAGSTPQETQMVDILGPLEILYLRHDAMATGRAPGDSTAVHRAILERLAANRLVAEGHGWTSCALERVAGMGQLRLWGIPQAGAARAVVPDWAPA